MESDTELKMANGDFSILSCHLPISIANSIEGGVNSLIKQKEVNKGLRVGVGVTVPSVTGLNTQ